MSLAAPESRTRLPRRSGSAGTFNGTVARRRIAAERTSGRNKSRGRGDIRPVRITQCDHAVGGEAILGCAVSDKAERAPRRAVSRPLRRRHTQGKPAKEARHTLLQHLFPEGSGSEAAGKDKARPSGNKLSSSPPVPWSNNSTGSSFFARFEAVNESEILMGHFSSFGSGGKAVSMDLRCGSSQGGSFKCLLPASA